MQIPRMSQRACLCFPLLPPSLPSRIYILLFYPGGDGSSRLDAFRTRHICFCFSYHFPSLNILWHTPRFLDLRFWINAVRDLGFRVCLYTQVPRLYYSRACVLLFSKGINWEMCTRTSTILKNLRFATRFPVSRIDFQETSQVGFTGPSITWESLSFFA